MSVLDPTQHNVLFTETNRAVMMIYGHQPLGVQTFGYAFIKNAEQYDQLQSVKSEHEDPHHLQLHIVDA